MYYPPFAAASKAGLGSIMCSYNKIDAGGQPGGTWSCENDITLGEPPLTLARSPVPGSPVLPPLLTACGLADLPQAT
jgi:hypothetical protein